MTSPARHRAREGRARWYLTGLALLLTCGVAAATLTERSGTGDAAGTATSTLGSPRDTPRYVFPVAGGASYEREHHDYPATDILADCGSPVLAVTSGVVLEVSRTDAYDAKTDDGAARGGLFVSLLGDDGVRYYGSHLRTVARGIDEGMRVRPGQRLGTVGDTGHARECHLHFGISPPCGRTGDWWIRRGTVWPWSYLDSWRRAQQASPARAVSDWHRTHGCPPTSAKK